jgi:hypothetical protein
MEVVEKGKGDPLAKFSLHFLSRDHRHHKKRRRKELQH